MSTEVKSVIDSLAGQFNTFKATYDRRLGEAAKAADARMDEIEKLISRVELSRGNGPRPDLRAERLAFASAIARRDLRPGETLAVDFDAYSTAFNTYLRAGAASMAADVRAAMSVGVDPAGGYWTPPEFLRQVRQRLYETSPVRQYATILQTTSDRFDLPIDNADLVPGGWIGETAARGETAAPQVALHSIYVHENYAQPAVTQKLLDMAAIDVETWLGTKIADRLARQQNEAFVTGDGNGKPRGFLSYAASAVTTADASRDWGVLQYVPTGASGGFATFTGDPAPADATPLIDLVHSMKAQHRQGAVWCMNSATAGMVRKLRDADSRFLWADSLAAGQPDRLLGYRVAIMEDMPDVAADSFSVAFANLGDAYMIVDGPALRVLRDPYTDKGRVRFYASSWTGGDVVNFDAIKLLKFGTS